MSTPQNNEGDRGRSQDSQHLRLLRLCRGNRSALRCRSAKIRQHPRRSEGIGLVYGGGGRGLMGVIANSVLAHGGTVTGIIPSFLTEREGLIENAQTHVIVPDMHSRKRMMFERRRCLRRSAGRHRHFGGTRRAIELGAARPSYEARRDRRYRRLLAAAARALRAYARAWLHPAVLRGPLSRRRKDRRRAADDRSGARQNRMRSAPPRKRSTSAL